MGVNDGTARLQKLSKEMKEAVANGTASPLEQPTIRELLTWYGYSRRGAWINRRIRNDLESVDLRTVPDFEVGWFDVRISIELSPEVALDGAPEVGTDPTVRVGSLDAANRPPTKVAPSESLSAAITVMLLNDFSQLPVMNGDRDVKGIITWQSIGMRLAMGVTSDKVSDCMEPHRQVAIVSIDTPLLDAVNEISRNGYVLVRGSKNEISGIVTASDVVDQFKTQTNPFLLVGEIEGYLRNLIHGRFTIDEMKKAAQGKEISGPADLTFGDYQGLLGNRDNWNKLGLNADRKKFVNRLNAVREIRNDVMHFNLDGMEDEHAQKLEGLASFFRNLTQIKAL